MTSKGLADSLLREVYRKYHAAYDNDTYIKATKGKSVAYANALIDESLALCGDPYYKVSRRHWGKDAIAHLSRFVEQNGG